MKFRHEVKHEISRFDMLALRPRLNAVMTRDSHAVDGRYFIRSLYFDNIDDRALREKIDGVNKRDKFRIRLYNGNTDYIMLEKKSKLNGLTAKEQCRLTEEEAQAAANGDCAALAHTDKPLLLELYREMSIHGLRGKTIVDYTREAFVYSPGNVRVTLDYDIRTGLGATELLNTACVTIPAGDAPIILEVKWDEFLPDIIRDIVQIPSSRATAFSKYAVCRIYG